MAINRVDITEASRAALQEVHVAELRDGCWAYTVAEDAYYVLIKNSGAVADGTFVLAPNPGSPIAGNQDARWVKAEVGLNGIAEVLRTGLLGEPTGGTQYLPPNYAGSAMDVLGFVITRPGILKNLRVFAQTPAAALETDTFTVLVNGVDTPMTVALTQDETCDTDQTNEVVVTTCDRVSVKLVNTNTDIISMSDILVAIEFYPA